MPSYNAPTNTYTFDASETNPFLMPESVDGATVIGNGLANDITGNSAGNRIEAGGGDDILSGGGGADTLMGGEGDDTYHYNPSATIIEEEDEGTDTLRTSVSLDLRNFANFENLTLTGNGHISATGNAAANHILGNAGNNRIDGGLGADVMDGGGGNDVYTVDHENDVVIELRSGTDPGGIDEVRSSVSFTLGENVEHLILTGVANIDGTGNGGNNDIMGNAGNNLLLGGGGNDTIIAGGGSDTLDGGDGVDTLIGGAGDDVYFLGVGDTVRESTAGGYDKIIVSFDASLQNNTQVEELQAAAGTANLNLTGSNMNDTLVGNQGDNVLNGKSGFDRMYGGAGNDKYYVDNVRDQVVETGSDNGLDRVYTTVNHTLSAHVENLVALGSVSVRLTGNAQSNIIVGRGGDDSIKGMAGNDRLSGGLGRDVLSGGKGKDIFVFDTKPHKTKNLDRITDFNVRDDTVWLDNAVFKKLGKKGSEKKSALLNKKFFKIGDKAEDKNDYLIYDKKTGKLFYDIDGSGAKAAVEIANLKKGLKMTYKDFFVI